MKTFIVAIAALFVAISFSTAQERSIKKSEVPSVILAAFEKSYPNAKVKGYAEEKDSDQLTYEVESTEGNIHRDVTYKGDGSLVSVEETLPVSELPEAVRSSLTKEFPKAKVLISEKVTKGSTVQYELLLKSASKRIEVVFNADGTIAKTEEKKRGEKD